MAKAGWKSRHKKEVSQLLATPQQPDEDEQKKTSTSSPPLSKPFPLNRSGGSSAFKPLSTHHDVLMAEMRRGIPRPSAERSSTSSECSSKNKEAEQQKKEDKAVSEAAPSGDESKKDTQTSNENESEKDVQ